jgi:hypothetical protein
LVPPFHGGTKEFLLFRHFVGTGGRTNERIVLTTRKKDDILEQKVKLHSFFSKIKPAPLVF